MNIDSFKGPGNHYDMYSTSFEWEFDPEKNLRVQVTENDAELVVSFVYKDGDERFLEDTDKDFWTGAVLYWYDAMTLGNAGIPFHKIQIDAIVRLSLWLGYVPHEDFITKYAVPTSNEVMTYNDQIDALAKDGFDFAIKLKAHRDSFKNAEGAD